MSEVTARGREVDLKVAGAAFVMLIPFCEPTYFANCLPLVDNLYTVFEFAALVYVAFKLIKDRKFSKAAVALLVFQLYLIVVTLYNGGRYFSALNALLEAVGVFLVVETFYEKDEKSFLAGGIALYFIIALASLASVFLYPDGLYQGNDGIYSAYYLYGHKNDILFNLFPGIVFALVYSIRERTRASFCGATIFLGLVFINVHVLDSATSSLACVALFIVFIVAYTGKLKRLNGLPLMVLVVFVFCFILLGGVQALFSGLFDAMNRNLTFSSRTFIWERAINAISQNPIFGHGIEATTVTKIRFGGFSTPHNFALAELFYGGVIGLLLIINVVWKCTCNVKNAPKLDELNFMMVALLLLFAMSTMESMGIGLVKFAAVLALVSCISGTSTVRDSSTPSFEGASWTRC